MSASFLLKFFNFYNFIFTLIIRLSIRYLYLQRDKKKKNLNLYYLPSWQSFSRVIEKLYLWICMFDKEMEQKNNLLFWNKKRASNGYIKRTGAWMCKFGEEKRAGRIDIFFFFFSQIKIKDPCCSCAFYRLEGVLSIHVFQRITSISVR